MSKLLMAQDLQSEESTIMVDGQTLVAEPSTRAQMKVTTINDIFSWLQAFAGFMAVLLSTEATSKEEAAGLATHLNLILQLAKDLGDRKWLKYDLEFREWAAAKNVRI